MNSCLKYDTNYNRYSTNMAPSTTLLRTWLLEEVLRYVQLSPLDVYHFGRGRKKEKHDRIVKILKVCHVQLFIILFNYYN